jgi:hypothetical protein
MAKIYRVFLRQTISEWDFFVFRCSLCVLNCMFFVRKQESFKEFKRGKNDCKKGKDRVEKKWSFLKSW